MQCCCVDQNNVSADTAAAVDTIAETCETAENNESVGATDIDNRDLLVIMKGKGSDDKDEEGNNGGPPGEAMVSMIICMIILTIFFIFFCLIPVYRCVVISRKF